MWTQKEMLWTVMCIYLGIIVKASIGQEERLDDDIESEQYISMSIPKSTLKPQIHYSDDVSVINERQTPNLSRETLRQTKRENLQSTLSELKRNTSIWQQNFESYADAIIKHINTTIIARHEQIQNSLLNAAEQSINRDKSQRVAICPNSLEALQFLFDKLTGEIEEMKKKLSPGANARNNLHIPPPSSTLATINKLAHRLNGFSVELETERKDNCSRPLFSRRDELTSQVEYLERVESERYRVETVKNSVEGILGERFVWVKQQLTQITDFGGSEQDLQLALQETINKILSGKAPLSNVGKISTLLKMMPHRQFRNATEFLIRTMTKNVQMDNIQFLILAYESKNAFGADLKIHFPENLQRLIWGGAQCVRNELSRQYLVIDKGPLETASQQREQGPPIKLSVRTSRIPSNNSSVSTSSAQRQILSQFCGWEFYPMLDGDSMVFIIRKTMENDLAWNLSVGEDRVVHVSLATLQSRFIWKIIPRQRGQSLSMYSVYSETLPPLQQNSEALYSLWRGEVFIGYGGRNNQWLLQDNIQYS